MTDVTPQSLANTIVAITLQTIILICLISRISVSALFSPAYSHLSFCDRFDKLPGATIALWVAFFGEWIYALSVDILQHGTDLSHHMPCTIALYLCLILYVATKVLIMIFLAERAHVVRGMSRREDRMYWFNICYIIVIVVIGIASMTMEPEVVKGKRCFFNVTRSILIPALVSDTTYTFSITVQLIRPILRLSKSLRTSSKSMPREQQRQLMAFARRTIVGTVLGSALSCSNILQLVFRRGKEDAWACLLTCSGDIFLNCLILHFITAGRVGTDESLQKASDDEEEFGRHRSRVGDGETLVLSTTGRRGTQDHLGLEEIPATSSSHRHIHGRSEPDRVDQQLACFKEGPAKLRAEKSTANNGAMSEKTPMTIATAQFR